MIIINYSNIVYSKGEEINLKKQSNIVEVKFVNPIVCFFKCPDQETITIKIKNNSGQTIRNVTYRECPLLNVDGDIIINNNRWNYQKNKEIIYLGSIPNNCYVVIKYKLKNKTLKVSSLLSYNLTIKNKITTMYITDNINFQAKNS